MNEDDLNSLGAGMDFPATIDEAARQIELQQARQDTAVQLAPFEVKAGSLTDDSDPNLESATNSGDDSSSFMTDLGSWWDDLLGTTKQAATDVAKAAINKAKTSATQSLAGKGSTNTSKTTSTTTNTSKTTILGMSPQMALVAAVGVGLLVYLASRNRGAMSA